MNRRSILRNLTLVFALVLVGQSVFASDLPPLRGRVVDVHGQPVHGVRIELRSASGASTIVASDRTGDFTLPRTNQGDEVLELAHPSFQPLRRPLSTADVSAPLTFVLQPAAIHEDLVITASRIAAEPRSIPGAVEILDRSDLESDRVFNTSEALRKAAGVNVRDEEGFGLRPNIGIRGLNPTRSSKVLLLEDGVFLSYAPYGDNASYYHPPIERYESVEIVKGSGQIAYGPSTVGGVINYVTPNPPSLPSLRVHFTGGNRDYKNGEIGAGATWGRFGGLLTFMRKDGDGARANTHSRLDDFFGKATVNVTEKQYLTFRSSYYTEDSMVTYSGLRQAEYEADPRQNPFSNDSFEGRRLGGALTHAAQLSTATSVTTTLYGSRFKRHWWRQSSNSGQRPNDSGDPNCGGMSNLQTTCGNEGRLREYGNWGVESRARFASRWSGIDAESEVGVRVHAEDQERLQVNGETPTARSGQLVENNERRNEALATFAQMHLAAGRWTLTPGMRIERILFERTNRLGNAGAGVTGRTDLTELVPGVGLAFAPRANTTIFAGFHRGFAPPRTEDIISNTNGAVVDLDAERSWNAELGARTTIRPGLELAATVFRMDYENQIIAASVAGGIGATLTNAGRTLHEGLEISGRTDSAALFGMRHNIFTKFAYTYLPTAEFVGARFSSIPGSTTVSVTGNRLPYAPERLFTGGIGYLLPTGSQIYVEAVHVDEQFGDDLNTVTPTADGQRGLIPAYTILNATVNVDVPNLNSTFFVTVKNALDRDYIVDRTRGILPGSPRLIQAGFTFRR